MAQRGYAVAAYRDAGLWRAEPLPPAVLDDLGVLLQALRSQPPEGGPFVVASPCSGHGAKFTPLLGEIIADLAAGKPAPDPRFTLAAHGVTRG